MAKEMNVSSDFFGKPFNLWVTRTHNGCDAEGMDKNGKTYIQRRYIYMHTLKYRRWNNELTPFQSLKRRVTNIFQKQNSLSDNSRGTSTQTIINNVAEWSWRS